MLIGQRRNSACRQSDALETVARVAIRRAAGASKSSRAHSIVCSPICSYGVRQRSREGFTISMSSLKNGKFLSVHTGMAFSGGSRDDP